MLDGWRGAQQVQLSHPLPPLSLLPSAEHFSLAALQWSLSDDFAKVGHTCIYNQKNGADKLPWQSCVTRSEYNECGGDYLKVHEMKLG